jgi:DNA-binding response OmpR family regulator
MIDDIKPPTPKQQPITNDEAPVSQIPVEPASTMSNAKNILVIEDEPFIGDLYKRALLKAGYRVEVVIDGTTGLEKAKSNEFDIILLDIMIPQILGVDVLHELRKVPGLKSKLIIATNLEQDLETRAKIEQEADAYIIKAEITPAELVEFLKNF